MSLPKKILIFFLLTIFILPATAMGFVLLWGASYQNQTKLLVDTVDYYNDGSRTEVVLVDEGVYVYDANGALLCSNPESGFVEGRNGKWITSVSDVYSGFYDHVFVSGDSGESAPRTLTRVFSKDCELVEDFQKSYVYTPYLRDVDSDGCDELIYGGKALDLDRTKKSNEWVQLWDTEVPKFMDEVYDWDFENGFCYNEYIENIVCVNGSGNVKFRKKPLNGSRNIAVGDFDGKGIKNDVATVGVKPSEKVLRLYIGDEYGKQLVLVEEKGKSTSLPRELVAGQIDYTSKTDELVFGAGGVINAYDSEGRLLWNYAPEMGGYADNIIIADVENDGKNEVVVAQGSKIYVLDNEGGHLFNMTVNGVSFNWHGTHPTMQVQDITGDCCKEILLSTNSGDFYVYGLEECGVNECDEGDLLRKNNCFNENQSPFRNYEVKEESLWDVILHLFKDRFYLIKKLVEIN